MTDANKGFCDFSNLVANEVEIETTNTTSNSNITTSKPKVIEPFFEPADYSNGALYVEKHYCWSQTFTEIEIHIKLAENVTSKNLKVKITNTSIDVFYLLNNVRQEILSGPFFDKCKAMDVMWTITGGNKLNISIDKTKQIWWKKLIQQEPDIDAKEIDCSRPMNELPEETQAYINKLQFDEQQKLKGELTSDEMQQQEMLRKAWDAEGSPFKGQPFDPNILQYSK